MNPQTDEYVSDFFAELPSKLPWYVFALISGGEFSGGAYVVFFNHFGRTFGLVGGMLRLFLWVWVIALAGGILGIAILLVVTFRKTGRARRARRMESAVAEGNTTISGVLARLGNVIYWIGCGIAALIALLAAVYFLLAAFPNLPDLWAHSPTPEDEAFYPYVMVVADHPPTWELIGDGIIILLGASGVWLAGRAVRYVLGGR